MQIVKDTAGFPASVIINTRYGKTTVNFDSQKGLKIIGKFNDEVANVLKMVYPASDTKTTQSLLDSGTLIHRAALDIVSVDVELYTVPVNRVFYLLMYDLDCAFPVGWSGGAIYFWDGLLARDISGLGKTNDATIYHDHAANNLCLKVPSGTVIHGISWGDAWVNAQIIGVEI